MGPLGFKRFLICLVCFVGSSAASYAVTPSRYDQGATIILSALNNSQLDLNGMIEQIVASFRSQLGVCKYAFGGPEAIAECLRGNDDNDYEGELSDYVTYAVKHGQLDSVEGVALSLAFTAIDSVTGTDPSGVKMLATPLADAPTGSDATLPPLLPYRMNKADFAALRKAKNGELTLPAALATQMSKSFPRKINGVGNVTPEQYFAAQLGRLQLNELAGLMVSAADFLARPDATVMLYPADYFASTTQLKSDESQEVALAEEIAAEADPTKRAPLQSQLSALETQTSSLQQSDKVATLTEDRFVKNDHLMQDVAALANPQLTDSDRVSLGQDLQTTSQQIDQIDQQLADLIRTQTLAPEDVQRFAVNSLHADFQTLIQQSPFNQMRLVPSDALLAAWVSGDISSQALTILSQFPGLKETNESIWQKALGIAWDVAKPALMIFPTTSYVAIAISIILEVQESNTQSQEAQSGDTHLIPLQP